MHGLFLGIDCGTQGSKALLLDAGSGRTLAWAAPRSARRKAATDAASRTRRTGWKPWPARYAWPWKKPRWTAARSAPWRFPPSSMGCSCSTPRPGAAPGQALVRHRERGGEPRAAGSPRRPGRLAGAPGTGARAGLHAVRCSGAGAAFPSCSPASRTSSCPTTTSTTGSPAASAAKRATPPAAATSTCAGAPGPATCWSWSSRADASAAALPELIEPGASHRQPAPRRPPPSAWLPTRGSPAAAATTCSPPSAPATSAPACSPPAWAPPAPLSAYAERPLVSPHGELATFCASSGGRPLARTMNLTGACGLVQDLLHLDLDEFSRLAAQAPVGAEGLLMLPFFDGERVPALPHASASLHGMTAANLSRANLCRRCSKAPPSACADGLDLLRASGLPGEEVRLVGGAAKNPLWRRTLADLLWPAAGLSAVDRGRRPWRGAQAAWSLGRESGAGESLKPCAGAAVALDESTRTQPQARQQAAYEQSLPASPGAPASAIMVAFPSSRAFWRSARTWCGRGPFRCLQPGALRAATSWASPRSPAARRSTSPSACAGWAWRRRCSAAVQRLPGARALRRVLEEEGVDCGFLGAQRRPDHPGDGRPRRQRLGAHTSSAATAAPTARCAWNTCRRWMGGYAAARRLLYPGGDTGGRHRWRWSGARAAGAWSA